MHLIFDFDGTLVDSFDCVVKQFNRLAEDYKYRKLDLEQINELRNLSARELLALFDIPLYKIPAILYKARKSLHKDITSLQPFNNIPQILETLFDEGFSLGIVSSNSEENIIDWLKHHQLQHYFSFIHAGSSFWGKKRVLKNIIRVNKIEHAFYIGDETRDIEAAKHSNICSIAVTWGFNSEQILIAHQPHGVAREPFDIVFLSRNQKNLISNTQ